MTMLKTHIVKDVKKSGPGKLIGLVAGLLLGVFGLLKLKDQIEEWEAEEEERLAIAEAEEEARRMAEEEAARARGTNRPGRRSWTRDDSVRCSSSETASTARAAGARKNPTLLAT